MGSKFILNSLSMVPLGITPNAFSDFYTVLQVYLVYIYNCQSQLTDLILNKTISTRKKNQQNIVTKFIINFSYSRRKIKQS